MSLMILMRGGPGVGKSRLAKELAEGLRDPDTGIFCMVYSADDFFVGGDGQYRFLPDLIAKAHGACLKGVVEHMTNTDCPVIVDNTNARPEEMIPYLALCNAFDYTCEVVTVTCDLELAWYRQIHNLPRDKFEEIHHLVATKGLPSLYKKARWLTTRTVDTTSGGA
jgi:tRNA uridine 5-carbamoylmethylation protein Kti12